MTAQPEDNETPALAPEDRAEYLAAFYPDGDVIDLRDKISERNQCIQAAKKNGNKVACDEWDTEKKDLEQQLKDLLSERRMHGMGVVPETAPTPAPAAPPESVVMPSPAPAMTKAGLVKAHIHRWPTIESDLSDASRNGLSVAKAGERRWDEREALAWARSRGKLHMESIAPTPEQADPMAAHYLGGLSKLPSRKYGG